MFPITPFPEHAIPHSKPHQPSKYRYENADDLGEALKHLDYVRWLIAQHADFMQEHKCVNDAWNRKSCQPEVWKNCFCASPAKYSDEGRGNCNLGATKPDLKVWCYVDPHNGDPAKVCPDSKPSKSKPGYYWSRFACIT